jgi:putative endonuclease
MTAPRRRRAWQRGRRGEGLAACWLRLKGYRLLARNFRCGAGEIDLIACRGRVLALVEVKTRGDLASSGRESSERHRPFSSSGPIWRKCHSDSM